MILTMSGRQLPVNANGEVGIVHAHHKQTAPPIKHPVSAAEPNLSAADARRERFGAIAISTWFLGGWGVLFVLMLLNIGPVVWISGWLNRLAGSDSSVLAFAIAFGVISFPVGLLQPAPWQGSSPFLRGAQRPLSPTRDPNFVIHPLSPDEISAALLRMIKVLACLSVLSLIAGIGAYRLMTRTPAEAGKPLPVLSPQQIIARQDHLSGYVTLTTLAPGFPANWIHRWSIRQTRYADLYFPIDPPGTRADAPARIVGKVPYVLSNGENPGSYPVLEAPIDGKLEIAALPAWMRQRMAEQGFVVPDRAIMFTPDDNLHGRFPGADEISSDFVRFLGIGFAMVFAIIGLILAFRRHRLLNTKPTQ
jgi:hypothetical protein